MNLLQNDLCTNFLPPVLLKTYEVTISNEKAGDKLKLELWQHFDFRLMSYWPITALYMIGPGFFFLSFL